MFENLQVFRMADAMARHSGARQAVIAQNMANADTPGYEARDLKPFQAFLKADTEVFRFRATRPDHLNGVGTLIQIESEERDGAESDPNGNSVSLESEMIHAVDVKRQHDRALAIYRTSLNVLRTAIGRR